MAVLTTLGSPTLDALRPSFGRHLLAGNKSPKTVRVYLAALRVLTDFVTSHGMPLQAASIDRHYDGLLLVAESTFHDGTISLEGHIIGSDLPPLP